MKMDLLSLLLKLQEQRYNIYGLLSERFEQKNRKSKSLIK